MPIAVIIAGLAQLAGLVPTFLKIGSDVAPLVTFIGDEITKIKSGGAATADEIAQLDKIAADTDAALAAAVADNAQRAAAGEGQATGSGGVVSSGGAG